jgi:hypothetical protein
MLILGARALFRTVDVVDASRPEVPTTTTAPAAEAGEQVEAEPEPEVTTTTTLPPRQPGEVTVRVGNAAQRAGIAAAGGDRLGTLGYNVVDLKNAPPRATSVVYHAEGYEAEARAIAAALGIPEAAVGPVPPNPEVDAAGVAVLVVLGADTTVG